MNFTDNCSDSDSELIANDSIIGKILIQMKSEFNKGPIDCTAITKKSSELTIETTNVVDALKSNLKDDVKNMISKDVIINYLDDEKTPDISAKLTDDASPVTEKRNKVLSDKIIKNKISTVDSCEAINNSNCVNNSEDTRLPVENVTVVPKKTKIKTFKLCTSVHNEVEDSNEMSTDEKDLSKDRKKGENIRPPGRCSLRNKSTIESTFETQGPKRSSRRLSKDFGETVLQSAIARKEKSYNETTKPQRLSRRFKPNVKKLSDIETFTKNTRNKRRNLNNEKIKLNEENNINNIESTPMNDTVDLSTIQKKNKNIKLLKLAKKNIESIKEIISTPSSETTASNVNSESSPEIQNDNENEVNASISFSSTSTSSEVKKPLKRRKFSDNDNNTSDSALLSNVRRRSHRRPPSPHLIEQTDELPPDQPTISPIIKQSEIILKTCLCLKRTQLRIEFPDIKEIFCSAVDSINGKCIGCNNMADVKDIRRPSTRVPFLTLCSVHFQRLIRHNCCPGCGMFCTEGNFISCVSGHQYHRECISTIDLNYGDQNIDEPYIYCLHCGSIEHQTNVNLVIQTPIKPAFLPFQRSYYPAAKIKIQFKENDEFKLIEDNGCYLENNSYKKIPKLYPMNGKDPRFFSLDHLYESAETDDTEKLMEIIASGIDVQHSFDNHDGDTALHAACSGGHKLAAYVLLVAGASVNAINASQKTPLMKATLGFHEDILSFLIKNGAKINFKGADGMTALHLAAKIGFLNGCKILVAASNINKQFIDEKDDGGWTSLVWACEHAHGDIAKFLLWRGADPHIRDLEHNVPLHWAAFGGNYETIDLLINLGVDVNAKNVHKESPLHIAARQDRYDCVLILLAHTAIPDSVNSDGETPLDCCSEKSKKCKDIISLNIYLRSLFASISSKDPILTNDISNGKELNPIQCVNSLDNEPKPTDFVYTTENCITSDITIDRKITTLQACRCEDKCGTQSCQCNNISLRCWYDDEERLLPDFDYLDPPMIFECNQMCSCNTITCKNRVVQRGLTQRFQIFRTDTKGWGVRTLRFIQRGTYVCEYIGEILSDLEADQREDDSYLFDLDSRVCKIGSGLVTKEGETYCIDARKYGNLARFINHHCSPNLLPVRIFIDHQDLHFPRIAFFANQDIAADEELGFDYGEKFWIIKCKLFTCTCGSDNCRYSDVTIDSTLKAYQLKEEQITLQQQQLLNLNNCH